MWPTPILRKKAIATETDTEEKHVNISLIAHSHIDIQSKTEKLLRNASTVGLHVNNDQNNAKQLSNS